MRFHEHQFASSMHQPVELLSDLDTYLDQNCTEFEFLSPSLRSVLYYMAWRVVDACHEYVDDGTDPLEVADIGNSELDFIDPFIEEVNEQNSIV